MAQTSFDPRVPGSSPNMSVYLAIPSKSRVTFLAEAYEYSLIAKRDPSIGTNLLRSENSLKRRRWVQKLSFFKRGIMKFIEKRLF